MIHYLIKGPENLIKGNLLESPKSNSFTNIGSSIFRGGISTSFFGNGNSISNDNRTIDDNHYNHTKNRDQSMKRAHKQQYSTVVRYRKSDLGQNTDHFRGVTRRHEPTLFKEMERIEVTTGK